MTHLAYDSMKHICQCTPDLQPIMMSQCLKIGCRVVLTDHGSFVLINVYVPNAGPFPERPRAAYKYKFLEALKTKAVSLRDAGRQVIAST
jgi:exonuclease III